MKDQVLKCRDCGSAFTFTAGEQEFFASRGFTSAPSRCKECRASRKAAQGDSYSTYQRRQPDMYPGCLRTVP